MGHTPSATKGRALIVAGNKDILAQLCDQADIAIAKQDADRDASLAAIKERHANELKAAKRNHKHRAKRIKQQLKEFEDMDPMELAERFKHGVPEGTVSRPFSGGLRDFQIQAINSLVGMDMASIEKRLMHSMMIPTARMITSGRREGKSEALRQLMLHSPELKIKPRHEWPSAFDIETRS